MFIYINSYNNNGIYSEKRNVGWTTEHRCLWNVSKSSLEHPGLFG